SLWVKEDALDGSQPRALADGHEQGRQEKRPWPGTIGTSGVEAHVARDGQEVTQSQIAGRQSLGDGKSFLPEPLGVAGACRRPVLVEILRDQRDAVQVA